MWILNQVANCTSTQMICKTVSFTANSKPQTATVDQKY